MSHKKVHDPHSLNRSSVLIVVLCGFAGTIQYHSAQFLSRFDTFFGDRGDARGFVYFCEHWYQSILGRASLLSPAIFYPTKGTLAYSDLLMGVALPYSLFRALGLNMFTAVEVVIILTTFLSYCATFWLLYYVLRFGLAPSILAAMFFAFSGPKFFQTIHLQLQFVVLLPLIFGLVISFAKHVDALDQKRAAILLSAAVLCFNLQLTTAFYYAWFFVLWSIIFLLLALIVTPARRFMVLACRKSWPALLISAAVFVITFIPILLLYLPAIRAGTWYRFDFISQMIPDWRAVLAMGDGNYLWGRLPNLLWPNGRPDTWGELQVGIGVIGSLTWIGLSVLSLWWLAKRGAGATDDRDKLGTTFLAIMVLATSAFYLIGFKYGGHSPWAYIYKFFPGAGAIRAVARYVIFLTLPMAIAFGYALHKALDYASRSPNVVRRRVLTTVIFSLAIVGVFEQFSVHKISGTGFSKTVEESYLKAMAAKLTPDCSAFYIAIGPQANHSVPEYQYDAMLLSLLSRVPTLNASSSQFPRDWNMYFVNKPDYEEQVRQWIVSQSIRGHVCRLETGPEVEAFDPKSPSPVDDPQFFVRQLYRDFTGEEPKVETITPQIEKLEHCNKEIDETNCNKTRIALNMFLTTGFHERGSFILRMYQTGLRRLPTFEEFTSDMGRFRNYLSAGPPEVAKKRMIDEFLALNAHNITTSEKPLQELVDSDELVRRLSNRNFVALHYYGFLRRQPDEAGLASWTNMLDRRGDPTMITTGIITSAEYRHRLEMNRLNNSALNGSYQRLSNPFGLVPRKNIVSAKSSRFGAPLFNG